MKLQGDIRKVQTISYRYDALRFPFACIGLASPFSSRVRLPAHWLSDCYKWVIIWIYYHPSIVLLFHCQWTDRILVLLLGRGSNFEKKIKSSYFSTICDQKPKNRLPWPGKRHSFLTFQKGWYTILRPGRLLPISIILYYYILKIKTDIFFSYTCCVIKLPVPQKFAT